MIEVKNLVKKYGEHLAVSNLSFTVEKGEILGFLGPNGAGKSTTMNMITGYISATEGNVIVNGHDIFDEPEEAKKSIGYLPEIPPLYPDMTVKEYLSFVADIKKVPRSKKAKEIEIVMRKTGVEHYSNTLIKYLSKGYRQRVGLAQAIVGSPDLIILDEPTVGLDPMQIIEIRTLIKDLSKNHAVILSSHILAEISAVCDKVMIINEGHLIVSDTPANLGKHFKDSNSIRMTVKGSKEKIHNALSSIKEIAKIEYKKSMTENSLDIVIQCSAQSDIRERIFYALASIQCPILEMTTKSMNLEDIFIKITKEDSINNVGRGRSSRGRLPMNKSQGKKEGK